MRECVLFKSVFGEFTFNLGVAAAGAVAFGVTALRNKVVDYAVKC